MGIVPIVGEPIGEPHRPTRMIGSSSTSPSPTRPIRELHEPLPRCRRTRSSIVLGDPLDVGAEFVRWEVATAAAGIVLGIDPFDQPNVQEIKDATRELLEAYRAEGRAPAARCRWSASPASPSAPIPTALGRYARSPSTAPSASCSRCSSRGVTTSPSWRTSRPTPTWRRASSAIRVGVSGRARRGHHPRLRAAVPALDRPAAQGRTGDRCLRPADRRSVARIFRSRRGRSRSGR